MKASFISFLIRGIRIQAHGILTYACSLFDPELPSTQAMSQLRFFFRQFAGSKATMTIALLSLSLGLGLVIAQLGLVNGVWMRGLPYDDADRLVQIQRIRAQGDQRPENLPIDHLLDYQARQTSLEAFYGVATAPLNIVHHDQGISVFGAYITPGLFECLGVSPLMGRSFEEQDLQGLDGDVVIIGFDLWNSDLQADPDIIGKSLIIEGKNRIVKGVMPRGFRFPFTKDCWMPLTAEAIFQDTGWQRFMGGYGKMRPEASLLDVKTEYSRLVQEFPTPPGLDDVKYREARVRPLIDLYVDDYMKGVLYMMTFTAVMVLLVASANVSNLLLARMIKRGPELSIRGALGAGRRHIIQQILGECLLLGAFSLLIGWALAWGIRWILRFYLSQFYWADFMRISFDLKHQFMVLAVALLVTLAAGIYPAFRASQMRLQEGIKEGTRSSTHKGMNLFSQLLIVAQIAFSFALLSTCGLLMNSVYQYHHGNRQYQDKEIVCAWLGVNVQAYGDLQKRWAYFQDVIHRVEESPLVEQAALTSHWGYDETDVFVVHVSGTEYSSPDDYPKTHLAVVSENYFELLDIPVLQGESFRDAQVNFNIREGEPTPSVAMVNESFARQYWPNEASPLGQYVYWQNLELRVVGIVPDLQMEGTSDTFRRLNDPSGIYILQAQGAWTNLLLYARTYGPAAEAVPELQKIMTSIDPTQRVTDVLPFHALMAEWTEFEDFLVNTFMFIGIAALIISLTGIFSVISYLLEQRRSETAIRLAIGALPGAMLAKALLSTLWKIALGLLLGMLGFNYLSKLFEPSLLVKVSPIGPMLVIAVLLLIICLIAAAIPTIRMLRMNLAKTLRED